MTKPDSAPPLNFMLQVAFAFGYAFARLAALHS